MNLRDPQLVADVLAGATIGVGLLQLLVGYRIFKFVLALTGFFLGMMGGAVVADHFVHSPIITLVAGAVGGLLGAAIVVTMYYAGVFLMGAVLAVLLTVSYFGVVGEGQQLLVVLIAAAAGGLLALVLQKFMIIVSTSFAGAWGIVLGGAHFARVVDLQQARELLASGETRFKIIVGVWIALGIGGVLIQYKVFPKKEGGGDGGTATGRRRRVADDVSDPGEPDGYEEEEEADEEYEEYEEYEEEYEEEPEEAPAPAPAPVRPAAPAQAPRRPSARRQAAGKPLQIDQLLDEAEAREEQRKSNRLNLDS